jgi:hypothetical protein
MALVTASRLPVNPGAPAARSSPASARYTAATLRCSATCGNSSQPGTMSSSAQAAPASSSNGVCHQGRSAPRGPVPNAV